MNQPTTDETSSVVPRWYGRPSVAQADGHSKRAGGFHQYLKKQKARLERRKAKRSPDVLPTYGKYKYWEM